MNQLTALWKAAREDDCVQRKLVKSIKVALFALLLPFYMSMWRMRSYPQHSECSKKKTYSKQLLAVMNTSPRFSLTCS